MIQRDQRNFFTHKYDYKMNLASPSFGIFDSINDSEEKLNFLFSFKRMLPI